MSEPSLIGKCVLVTRPVPESGLARLAAAGVTIDAHWRPQPLQGAALRRRVARADGVICQVPDRIDADVLVVSQPRCRIFANCAVGTDNIDIETAARLGIVVTNTPDVLTEATADLTWGLLLATARRLGEAERALRAGAWRGWNMLDYLGADVHGKTLGIIGAGRIGQAVARRATGFDMQIRYVSRQVHSAMDAIGARRVGLNELLEESDFVSLHVPLTPQTHRLLGADAFARMKRTAILINTARGAVIDEQALIEALRGGRIAGAGLDVFEREPMVPRDFQDLPNVVLLPHIGSATVQTRSRMSDMAAQNVLSVLRGRDALNPVRPP